LSILEGFSDKLHSSISLTFIFLTQFNTNLTPQNDKKVKKSYSLDLTKEEIGKLYDGSFGYGTFRKKQGILCV
jgi:hypothetical protein